MQEFLAPIYLWLKAGHIIFVIFWMAGLFMLPRLFVYHQEAPAGSEEAARYADREQKLLKIILLPSIIVVWVLGLSLLGTRLVPMGGWFHLKLLLVLALSGYHGYLSAYAKKLARGEPSLSGKQMRLLNEVPGVAAALIVVLAIVKPF
ncbi:MAG: CopD family protein [Erythrobacter sp.]|nr:MAG: CopD family protein [Erythrobacter sp.]